MRRAVGIVYGWVFAAHMFGAAIAAWVAGIVRESVGDYAPAFVAAGWIAILAGFAAFGPPSSAFRGACPGHRRRGQRIGRGGRTVTGKRTKRRAIGETIGGIIVGFDQQIFRTTPPVQALIAKARPVRGVSGQDGTEFEVVFPQDDEPSDQPDPAAEAVEPDR